MLSLLLNENRTIWLALIASSLMHGLILIFSGPTFIQHAQYSVRPSAQMVEVSIETLEEIKVTDTFNKKVSVTFIKRAARSISGVRGKANPDYFQNPSPEYPELAKQMRQEGLVLLAVDVDREGIPTKVEIEQSSGYSLLDQAAVKAVSCWKFQPGRMGDIPVESAVTIPIRFRLEK